MQKVNVQFQGCGYKVYPVGTKVNDKGTLRTITNVYIDNVGEIFYEIDNLTNLIKYDKMEKMALHSFTF